MMTLQLNFYYFNSDNRLKLPDLHTHITRQGLPWALFATKWFVCLYVDVLPVEVSGLLICICKEDVNQFTSCNVRVCSVSLLKYWCIMAQKRDLFFITIGNAPCNMFLYLCVYIFYNAVIKMSEITFF